MPSLNPRLALTLKPERYDLLKRLAALQGSSMAAVVSETMELVYPMLERVCVVLEAAQRAQESRADGLREAVSRVESELSPLLYEVASQFDLFMEQAGQAVGAEPASEGVMEQVRKIMAADDHQGSVGGGTPPDGPGSNPRPVIRGSGQPTPPQKSPPSPSKKPSPRSRKS